MVLCLAFHVVIFFPCYLTGGKLVLTFWLASWISPALCLRIALHTYHSNNIVWVSH